ncbi:ABC transporter permease [Aestuariivirga litoralis]|uniref:ABC transporter permease n=1 Tax=Aestuariivirga litoralis TaxID=2650924 RepID=UPI0018C6AFAC|nr:ABC transporter permease [Aestuariivirga litoralis]MBG1232512.1 ABC transporter permease [Aestuariivirga litoralis]
MASSTASAMRPTGFSAAMLAPGLLVTCLFILAALGLLVFLAFRHNDGSLLGSGLTIENFITLATDPLYIRIILRSLLIAGVVTCVTVITAYPVAYYLSFHAGKHRRLILFLVTLPFWTSYLLRVFAWKIVLAFNGVLNSALLGGGLVSEPTTLFINTPYAVVVTLAHAYAPFAILPILVSLDVIPRNLLEAAADLGAKPFTALLRVTIPNSMPGVLAGAVVVFVPTVGDYVTPALVGGPDSTMIGSLIQAQFGKAQDWPFGSALAVLVMLTVLLVMLLARRASKSWSAA